MNYKSVSDLAADIRRNLHKIPKDVDLIVGIPRSGLLAANLVALYLNKPLTTINDLLEGRILAAGDRGIHFNRDLENFSKILIIDDSVHSGKAITKAKEEIIESNIQGLCTWCTVYVKPGSESFVDIYLEKVEVPRLFEWNIFHHDVIANACVDIDGVLCCDPTEDQNDDGEQYRDFLNNTPCLVVPSVKIGTLVTCRLEKYRSDTEQWLNRNNIYFEELIMLNLPDKAARQRWRKYGEFKAEIYLRTNKNRLIFIESNLTQAKTISSKTYLPVFCVETNQILHYKKADNLLNKSRKLAIKIIKQNRFLYRLIKHIAIKPSLFPNNR